MTFREFEQRCCATPDLQLSPLYWNNLLPEVTGYALWLLWIWPALQTLTIPRTRAQDEKGT